MLYLVGLVDSFEDKDELFGNNIIFLKGKEEI